MSSLDSDNAKSLLQAAQQEFAKATTSRRLPAIRKLAMDAPLAGQLPALAKHLQAVKYPHPPYIARAIDVEVDGKQVPVMYVKTERNIELNDSDRIHIANHAYLSRAVALAATLDEYAKKNFPAEQYASAQQVLKSIINDEIQLVRDDANEGKIEHYDRTNIFISKLADVLMHNTLMPRKEAIDTIKRYERYVVSEQNAGQVFINESTLEGQNIIQMDIPLAAKLTKEQREEYLRILDPDVAAQPQWFRDLPQPEQAWYLEHIKEGMQVDRDEDWLAFEAFNKTSAMQQSLEIKNARRNFLIQDGEVLAESTKIATLNPIEAPKTERQVLTDLNADQLVSHLTSVAEQKFREHWGIPEDEAFDGQILIYSQGLLSPVKVFGKEAADASMVNAQREAINKVAENYADKFKVAFGNDGVNVVKLADTKSVNWNDTQNLIDYAENLLGAVATYPNAGKNIPLIKEAIKNLKELKNSWYMPGRNAAAHKAAYVGLLVEACGGQISTNCKSGKDRTGFDELYRNAMRLYYEKYKTLPKYTDRGKKRKRFIAIYAHLHNTLKVHEAAAANTPGSLGLKDGTSDVLCWDIAKKIRKDYDASNQRASLNKTDEKGGEAKISQKEVSGYLSLNQELLDSILKKQAMQRIDQRLAQLRSGISQKKGKKKGKKNIKKDNKEKIDQKIACLEALRDSMEFGAGKQAIVEFLNDKEVKALFAKDDIAIASLAELIKAYDKKADQFNLAAEHSANDDTEVSETVKTFRTYGPSSSSTNLSSHSSLKPKSDRINISSADLGNGKLVGNLAVGFINKIDGVQKKATSYTAKEDGSEVISVSYANNKKVAVNLDPRGNATIQPNDLAISKAMLDAYQRAGKMSVEINSTDSKIANELKAYAASIGLSVNTPTTTIRHAAN